VKTIWPANDWKFRIGAAAIFVLGMLAAASARQSKDASALLAEARDQHQPAERRKAAMLELLKSHKVEATDSVYELALRSETDINIRVQAVQAFGEAGSIENSAHLSFLLQLYNPFVLREAVALSINNTGCSAGCVSNVLHYLERTWNGEHAFEDRFMTNPSVKEDFQRDKRNLETLLLGALLHNKQDTRLVLANVYGLGTELPSPTAIRAVDKLAGKTFCPDLRKAYTLAPPPDESIRKQLLEVLDGTCRGR
jgi:hypothetical protein